MPSHIRRASATSSRPVGESSRLAKASQQARVLGLSPPVDRRLGPVGQVRAMTGALDLLAGVCDPRAVRDHRFVVWNASGRHGCSAPSRRSMKSYGR
jgi:hypothetical protein